MRVFVSTSPAAATATATATAAAAAATNKASCHLNLSSHRRFRHGPRSESVSLASALSRFDSRVRLSIRAMAEVETQKPKSHLAAGCKQALISLSDKQDLAFLGNGLQSLGYSIVSTGGTASALENAGVSVTKVEEITHFPEMLDGRVKTLHPSIHGGILARRDHEHHMEALNKHGIGTFDVVVVNLYPFYQKVSSSSGITFEDGIENIDIGPYLNQSCCKESQRCFSRGGSQ
ncbi:uncharacterized protein M6B38_295530 [Iris pallida]|uniref:MGS-like domain-containing protein n=1 Tax=Iris pallida TaxID=29817 RepID=A0AAX6HSP3_IRIPA|nr:uncharacterized protein M6B38_295530 [Iris pallida]